MNKHRHLIWLAAILFLAIFLRFYRLGEVPTGLSQDETSLGYNAYSILKTGKDERGVPYPISFQAFGEYKLAGYIYLSVPSIAVFGPTPIGVRLPSAACGVLTVLVGYLLVKEIGTMSYLGDTFFASQKRSARAVRDSTLDKNSPTISSPTKTATTLGLLTALLIAINPWHVNFSRAAFEVVPALLFMMLGVWGWAKWKNAEKKEKNGEKSIWLALGAVFFVLSIYTYNICKLLSPLLFLWLMWLGRKNIEWKKTNLYLAGLPAILLLVPFLIDIFWGSGYSSTTGTLLSSSPVVQAQMLETRMVIVEKSVFWSKVLFNDRVRIIYIWGQHIADYFSGSFWFANGSDHGNHGTGEMGMFYLWELLSIGVGLAVAVRRMPSWMRVIGGWIVLNIVIAAYTREAPHGTRGFFLIFPLAMLSAYGLQTIWRWLKERRKAKMKNESVLRRWCPLVAAVVGGVGIGIYSIGYYLADYYWRFPVFYAESWHDQDKNLAEFIKKNYEEYEEIIIDENALSNFLYVSLAYNLPIEPEEWQEKAVYRESDEEGFSKLSSVGKIAFAKVNFNEVVEISGKKLVITRPDRKPDNIEQKWAVFYPEWTKVGTEAGVIYKWPQQRAAYVAVVI